MNTLVLNPSLQSQRTLKLAATYKAKKNAASTNKIAELTASLSDENSWALRQAAARKLGTVGDPGALAKLLEALLGDPFWMVRQAIIQAVEMIGDAKAIPALELAAENDSFAVVRSTAVRAIERLRNR